jgi:peptidoglycan/LPS O-acetylase OafA/YrhL
MFYSVQYLRFIAARLVVMHHDFQFGQRYVESRQSFDCGAIGVDVFL